jgi:hypothetical protein
MADLAPMTSERTAQILFPFRSCLLFARRHLEPQLLAAFPGLRTLFHSQLKHEDYS